MKRQDFFLSRLVLGIICLTGLLPILSCKSSSLKRLNVVVELDVGESKEVELINGDIVNLSLIDINLVRDSLRKGIRAAYITVIIDGEKIVLGSGNYNLPVTVGKVKIDCPVIKEITATSSYYAKDAVLQSDARFRLWPKNSPYIQKGTFSFPLKQEWMASRTQSQNEPAGLGWAENLSSENMGYHATHDFGGAEAMEEIFSATDGLVVSSNNEVLDEYKDLPGDVRPDVVWVVDGRGWYIRYSHLNSIEPEIKAGSNVRMGQKIGYMGKQGGSGGWVHLHFGVHYKNPETSVWEVEDAYPYLWESYVKSYKPSLIAVARPHLLAKTGDEVTLDGSKSVSMAGDIVSYQWIFTDGTTVKGAIQQRSYSKAGEYSETLKIIDSNGNVDYDFTYVQVYDREEPGKRIPTIHPVYYPTLNIKAGDPVKFLVRTFGSDTGDEIWDFGDGSEKVTVNSGNVQRQTQNGGEYASTVHSFDEPGHYVVRVERINEHGFPAIGHLHVSVE
jgi:murein DD-endopeptidase MepM/ murein hydrolase activator NlpD